MAVPVLKRFYLDPYMQIRSFVTHLTLNIVLIALAMQLPLHMTQFSAWQLLLVPLGIYLGGISAVWIHNATHSSFKNPIINELCGEIAGMHQLWGFLGWKIIHLMHHQYSDNSEMDPHPPKGKTFWQFAYSMFTGGSEKISQRYRAHWGENARTNFLQKATFAIFVTVAITNAFLWYVVLGFYGFMLFFIPSYISNHLLFVDVNYTAHPEDADGNTKAANLNDTLYYKIANFFWFGIYFHGNHHRRPMLFNPRHMPAKQAAEELEREAA